MQTETIQTNHLTHYSRSVASSFAGRSYCRGDGFARDTQWDGEIFAFLGDVGAGNQLTVVEFPAANPGAFGRSAYVTVPMTINMTALWAAAAGADMLGPYAANAADTEHIRARYAVPIPQPYVEYCLVRGAFTPRTFWTDVIGQVLLNNRVATVLCLSTGLRWHPHTGLRIRREIPQFHWRP